MKYIKKFNESTQPKFELDENSNSFDKIVELLESDCKPFLDELMNNEQLKKYHTIDGHVIFRGSRPSHNEEIDNLDIYKKTVRTDRKALDSNKEISDMFDDIFDEKFGVRPRSSGVFTTKKYETTSAYGMRYIFVPIGEYKYYWNPNCDDLFTNINTKNWYRRFAKGWPYKPNMIKRFYDFITKNNLEKEVHSSLEKLVNGYKNTDLEGNSNQEIMFICKEYYLLDASWLDQYKQYLKSRQKTF
jgi:hypothetical protein